MLRYHHTQLGVWMLAALLPVIVLTAAALIFTPAHHMPSWPWVFVILLVVVAFLFSSLTVDVSATELRWQFGPGLWRYHIPLSDIASVARVRNSWANGFGIRRGPGFWLYNVSGLDAVELTLKSGERRRIGTDEPEALVAALRKGTGEAA